MVSIPTVVAAVASVYIALMTVAVLYLTYTALKKEYPLNTKMPAT
jgi:hypothetical protein